MTTIWRGREWSGISTRELLLRLSHIHDNVYWARQKIIARPRSREAIDDLARLIQDAMKEAYEIREELLLRSVEVAWPIP